MKTQAKLSKLQRWILREALTCGQLEKVRIMADYFSLPTREYASHRHGDPIAIVDRRNVDRKQYANAAISMNRSLKRLKERGLIKEHYEHYNSIIVLTKSGVTTTQNLPRQVSA
jgi:hypothetical protein